MESKKLKMNHAKFVKIWSAVVALVVVLALLATVLMNFFSLSMEIFLGRGEAVYSTPENMANADTNYYKELAADPNAYADGVAQMIAEEGDVLFKNNGVLPLAKGADVTPFGYRYVSPVYGGTGSAGINTSSSRLISAETVLNNYFTVNKEIENVMKNSRALGMDVDGYEGPNEKGGFQGATSKIIEYESSIYTGHESSCNGTTGIIFIGRIGGEGRDVCADVVGSPIYGSGYPDGTPHQLAISEAEKEMIRYAKANCDNTVVILNTSNVMEISELMAENGDLAVDAILWIGGPGSRGFEAMGRILCGEVNPSGKSVDTWMTDIMADPTMENFGNYEYDNLYLLAGGFPTPVGDATEMNFVEYEENIYMGYRYYETVHDTNGSFTVFGTTGCGYDEAVQVPFGQGLSYTTFTQELVSGSETKDTVTLVVKVTNTGNVAGKDVVQVYYNPPYTDLDVQMKVEKSTANLIAFDKTDELAPGASQELTIVIDKEDMASYCYTRQNADGTVGAYMLEKGTYVLSINQNAHVELATYDCVIDDTIWYDSENIRQSELDGQALLDDEGNSTGLPAAAEFDSDATFVAATNQFQSMTDYMNERTTQLTRASGTLVNTASKPTAAEQANIPDGFYYTVDESGRKILQQMDLSTDKSLGNVEGSYVYTTELATTGAEGALTVADMRGKSYFDPMWDTLLDQLDLTDYNLYVALAASYDQTAGIESVSKPATVDFDGTMGIVGSITDSTEFTSYPTEPVVGSSFNVDVATAYGDAVAQDAEAGGVNGWYAPGLNLHRTPFSGRNFEYYSEDPVLSGYMAAYLISAASERGLIVNMKHFALNDEEMYDNDRSRVSIWCNEQAIRELYLKPFEMAIKDARSTLKYVDENGETVSKVIRGASCIMGCMNYWGTVWGGSSYELLTQVLRNEWGFQGYVITDMMMNAGSNSVDQALRAGNDTWMAWGEAFTTLIEDTESATGISVIRRAVKNMCYTIANSRAMDGIAPGTVVTYKTSPWKIWLAVGDALAAVFVVTMVIVMVKRGKDTKEHPENYQPAKIKTAKS